ncbi:MAG: hypothetical protein HRU03_06225 [Nanoarchaeales archaeon]|nr:hypothetical protein [Nanoarchaeales archaeon]
MNEDEKSFAILERSIWVVLIIFLIFVITFNIFSSNNKINELITENKILEDKYIELENIQNLMNNHIMIIEDNNKELVNEYNLLVEEYNKNINSNSQINNKYEETNDILNTVNSLTECLSVFNGNIFGLQKCYELFS